MKSALAEIHQIVTKDGVPLEGLFFRSKKKSKIAAVWLGGLTSRFSKNPERTNTLADTFTKNGISFATFDHRGLGLINSLKVKRGKKERYIVVGTAFEKFEHSVLDIEAILSFLRERGYKKVFLLGHSTGANKAAHYIWKKGGRGLAGVGLLGPLSDIPGIKAGLGRKYSAVLKTAEKMVKKGKGKELIPFSLVNGAFWSAERFWSIAREGSKEDTFPYYNQKIKFYWAKTVRLPVFVVIGEKDQHADRPIKEILEAFKKQIPQKWFSGAIIKDADHGFSDKENILAVKLGGWIKGK
jgi:alpha-beta hydrolase superfamily lysophospholipase